jgi:dTMP kinase
VTASIPISILRDPAFARLWFIQASTQVGGNMALYALTILVFATTRSNAAVSALVMSFLIPTILLSAVAGVLVDRLDVRWALIGPNTVRTVLNLGLALAGANVALLLVLNLGISLTTVVLTPAEASMIPRVVPKPELETAMGIFNLTLQASFAVGFAFLGPLLVTLAGPSFVLGVVTVL